MSFVMLISLRVTSAEGCKGYWVVGVPIVHACGWFLFGQKPYVKLQSHLAACEREVVRDMQLEKLLVFSQHGCLCQHGTDAGPLAYSHGLKCFYSGEGCLHLHIISSKASWERRFWSGMWRESKVSSGPQRSLKHCK